MSTHLALKNSNHCTFFPRASAVQSDGLARRREIRNVNRFVEIHPELAQRSHEPLKSSRSSRQLRMVPLLA